jgi:hypothetical protein
MPSASEILASLQAIANDAATLAIVWHAVIFLALAAVAAGFRPSGRNLAWIALLPVLSVSVVAYWYGALFNCFVFAALAAALAFFVPREKDEKSRRGPPWAIVLGSALVAFGWTYPHFLDPSRSPLAYLYAAPVGLIPCPTLSLVIGVALVSGASGGTRGALLLAMAGLFYGLVGMVKLGVELDAVLVAGALGLLALVLGGASGTTPARLWRARVAGVPPFAPPTK